jgi:serine/threonine-protein kinase RsbW
MTSTTDREAGQVGDVIELSLPVAADLLVVVRLTAAAVASRAEFNVEDIEDLRLAVDELCLPLVRSAPEGRLVLRFIRTADSVEITACVDGPEASGGPDAASHDPEDALSAQILDALVDEHGWDGTGSRCWLRKRRSSLPV